MTSPSQVLSAFELEITERIKLYRENPTCFKCGQLIASVAEAIPVHRIDGSAYLIHFYARCFDDEVEDIVDSYLKPKAPIRWVSNG